MKVKKYYHTVRFEGKDMQVDVDRLNALKETVSREFCESLFRDLLDGEDDWSEAKQVTTLDSSNGRAAG